MNTTLLKPEHLAPIRNLNLRAKLIVEGMIAGLHKSPFHGFSAEFLEYRQYLTGESTRRIDWRKFAKTDKTVVRLFEDETNLTGMILLDKSASMQFMSPKSAMTKFDYARTLAASIAWILIRQRDAVGLALFDNTVTDFLPAHSTNMQLKTILSTLDNAQIGSQTKCAAAINTIAHTVQKRGLCVLISDLFDDPSQLIHGLRHLRFKRQDIIVLCILDPLEKEFKGTATLQMRDLETGEELLLDSKTATHFFNSGFTSHKEKIEHACRELRIDLETITTDEPFQRALFRVLEKRRRLF